MGPDTVPPTTLRSPGALLLGWRLLIGLPLLLFVLSIPARYQELAEMARRLSEELGAWIWRSARLPRERDALCSGRAIPGDYLRTLPRR